MGENTLRKPFGEVGVDGAFSFACTSPCGFMSSLTFPFVIRPLLRSSMRSAVRTFRHNQAAARRRSSLFSYPVDLPESEGPSSAPMSNRPGWCARSVSSFESPFVGP